MHYTGNNRNRMEERLIMKKYFKLGLVFLISGILVGCGQRGAWPDKADWTDKADWIDAEKSSDASTECSSVLENENESYPARVAAVNKTDYDLDAVSLSYMDADGQKQVLLSDEIKSMESAVFDLNWSGKLAFTLDAASYSMDVQQYEGSLNAGHPELWFDITDSGIAITFTGRDENAADNGKQADPENVRLDRYFQKDGDYYEKIRDLTDGKCHWYSIVRENVENGDEHIYERTDDGKRLVVRQWDNLMNSAGDYLIYEYNGTVHVAKPEDLYHPVLSLQEGAHGEFVKVQGGYMARNGKYNISFYDEDFQFIRQVEGYRCAENGVFYRDGLMMVRNMETGLIGYMDQSGDLAIPCIYEYGSDFYNGYASVLTGATLKPYTEDRGTVPMFDAEGGQWGIIDTGGNYVVEPSEKYANRDDEKLDYYCGIMRFSGVRLDGTADFMNEDSNEVIETVRVR